MEMNLLNMFPRIVGIGDSLMSGELSPDQCVYIDRWEFSWLACLCRRCGATPNILSMGGLTVETWLNLFRHFHNNDPVKYPLYFICLGSNDFGGLEMPIGSIDDKEDAKTYIGWYKAIIDMIKGKSEKSIILCCSMYNNESDKNSKGMTRGDYNKAVKSITELYDRCYYLDFINNTENCLSDTKDQSFGHYDSVGYYKVALDMERLANKILSEHIDDLRMIGLDFPSKHGEL